MKNLYSYFLIILLSSCLTSCVGRRLDVQTTYLTRESLASAVILTPDPARLHPSIGQNLLIQWNLRREFKQYCQLYFVLTVRFRNRQEQIIEKMIKTKQGSYLYEVLNEDYRQTGGIVTYHIEIYGDDHLIETWQHPLWTPLITFDLPSVSKDPASSAD